MPPPSRNDRFGLWSLGEKRFPFSSNGILLNFMKIQHQADTLSVFPIGRQCRCVFGDVCSRSVGSLNSSSWCRAMGRSPDGRSPDAWRQSWLFQERGKADHAEMPGKAPDLMLFSEKHGSVLAQLYLQRV